MRKLDKYSLEGRVALVTGGSRGIGRVIALGLAEAGATIAVHCIAPSPRLQETLEEIRKLSPKSVAITGDLSTPELPRKIVAEVIGTLGRVDILVANASAQVKKPWTEVALADAEVQMQVNFYATLRMIQAAVPSMQERKWGRILTIGSVQQHRPHPEMIVYAASKAAQENMVRNLAKQLGADGITVNNLAPGVINTERNLLALADAEYAEGLRAAIPLRYFGEPEDCVGAALLLCTEAGRYITGSDVRVDGGRSLG